MKENEHLVPLVFIIGLTIIIFGITSCEKENGKSRRLALEIYERISKEKNTLEALYNDD